MKKEDGGSVLSGSGRDKKGLTWEHEWLWEEDLKDNAEPMKVVCPIDCVLTPTSETQILSPAGVSVEALPSMSPSSTLLPPLISERLSPASHTLKTQKIDRYAAAFVHSDYDFAPVIFETSGALNKEGETVLDYSIRLKA